MTPILSIRNDTFNKFLKGIVRFLKNLNTELSYDAGIPLQKS